jgi:hypothetical protein
MNWEDLDRIQLDMFKWRTYVNTAIKLRVVGIASPVEKELVSFQGGSFRDADT